jgi:tetratricopeptide (TPR) repeat protein
MASIHLNYREVLTQLDTWTKQGRKLLVLKELTLILKTRPPQEFLPALARIAYRNHAYVLALRVLHPLMQKEREGLGKATPEALNIYATALMWIGSLEEAQKCLDQIRALPDALLTKAFIDFAKWDYQNAIPTLLTYINSRKISDYQKLVGKINLLAAYICVGAFGQARAVLEELQPTLSENPDYKILYGNSLELQSQIYIYESKFEKASVSLEKSEEVTKDQPGRYLLYVNKWKSILQLSQRPNDSAAQVVIEQVKKEALDLQSWETVRDCDFQMARITGNTELLHRTLAGTPYKGYHKMVQSLYGISLPDHHQLTFCPGEISRTPVTVSFDTERIPANSFLTSTNWALLQLMTKDIYRPPRMGVVFAALYSQEYFNPFTSPQRVRNSVFRFNSWAEKRALEFRIEIRQGGFFLNGPAGHGISCRPRRRALPGWQMQLKEFNEKNESKSFTSTMLADHLNMTRRNASSLIKKALNSRVIQKLGRGKNSRYVFFSGRRKTA